MKQNIEHIIKETLVNHEVPYKEGAWEKFQKNLALTTPFYLKKWFITAIALITIAVSSTIYFTNKESDISPITKAISANNKIEDNSISANLLDSKNNNTEKENNSKLEKKSTLEKATLLYLTKENSDKLKNQKETQEKQPVFESKLPVDNINTDSLLKITDNNPNEVITNTLPVADFFLQKSICEGEEIVLNVKEQSPDFTYQWVINGKTKLKGPTVKHTVKTNGVQKITLNILDKSNKTIVSKEQNIRVLASPVNQVEIKLDKNSLVNKYEFSSLNNSNRVIKWKFGDKEESTEISSIHTYKESGIYTVNYTLASQDGCKKTFSKKVEVKGYYNMITDYGFTPNGDNNNDNFIPEELKQINPNFVFSIYSRNGQQIYSTNSITQPWDGKLKDGSMSKFGSYIWVVSLTNELGKKEVYQGTITNVIN